LGIEEIAMAWFRKDKGPGGEGSASEQAELDAAAERYGPAISARSRYGITVQEPPEAKPEPTAAESAHEWFLLLKRRLHQEVIAAIDLTQMRSLSDEALREEVYRNAIRICRQDPDLRNLPEQEQLIEQVMNEAYGYGPIDELMADPSVSDILINGPRQVYVEKRGQLHLTGVAFHDENHLLQILQRVVAATGRRIDENSPMVDARLPDGSRLNAVIKPLALNGPLVSIRRFGARPLTADDLLKYGTLTPEMIEFLAACVRARINIVISGGTGSGKTTLLNCLSRYIHPSERITTIEDAAELMLQQPHVAKMETRPAAVDGGQEVTMRDLLRNTLRMRPDRIIIGECRGAEALDMLQAMNTGHEGSLTTVHANTPRDAVSRLEVMVSAAGGELPVWVVRKQIASAVNIIVQIVRLPGGQRKVSAISEITGIQTDVIMMHDIFEFVQTGMNSDRVTQGYFQATGMRPECREKLVANGIDVPLELFEPRRLLTKQERGG
jgi:pilus assembly protein CpaF